MSELTCAHAYAAVGVCACAEVLDDVPHRVLLCESPGDQHVGQVSCPLHAGISSVYHPHAGLFHVAQGVKLRFYICMITTLQRELSPSLICPLLSWFVVIFLPSRGCHLPRLRSKGCEIGRLLRATGRQHSRLNPDLPASSRFHLSSGLGRAGMHPLL